MWNYENLVCTYWEIERVHAREKEIVKNRGDVDKSGAWLCIWDGKRRNENPKRKIKKEITIWKPLSSEQNQAWSITIIIWMWTDYAIISMDIVQLL